MEFLQAFTSHVPNADSSDREGAEVSLSYALYKYVIVAYPSLEQEANPTPGTKASPRTTSV